MIRRALFSAFVVLNLAGAILFYKQWMPMNLILLLLPVNMLMLFGIMLTSKNQLKQLHILSGGKKGSKITFETIQQEFSKSHDLLVQVNTAIKGLDEVGKDNYEATLSTVTHAELKASLVQASVKMDTLHKLEIHNSYVAKGIASLGQIQYAEISREAYASQVVTMVVKYLNATQGALFLNNGEDENAYMELAASYALGEKNKTEKIYAGQGMLGQVMVDKEMVCVTNVPANYVKVTSGLGQALPGQLCIIPLVSDQGFYGALEIGSFDAFQPYQLEYLQKVSKTVGYNLASQESVRKTAALLLESTKLTEEMKVQEEEIRRNLEAITHTQHEMNKKHVELNTVLTSLATVELNMSGEIKEASDIFTSISGFKIEDIKGRLFKHLIPSGQSDQLQYDLMWSNLLVGKSFSGEFRLLNKDNKEVWIMGNFTPILDERGNPYKVMVISMFTTQDKEKLADLQESLNALKQCLPIAEVNKSLGLKTANELFLNSVGLKRIELKKASLASLFDEDSKQWIEDHFQNGSNDHGEMIVNIKTAEGQYKPCHITLVKVLDGTSFKRGFIIIKEELAHFNQLVNGLVAEQSCHA